MLHHAAAFCEMNELNSILALMGLKHINRHDKLCVKNALVPGMLDLSCKHTETSSEHLLAGVVITLIFPCPCDPLCRTEMCLCSMPLAPLTTRAPL